MNDLYLQLTGKSFIEEPMEKDKSYSIAFKEIGIYGVDERTNNDGASSVTFKGKNIGEIKIIGENKFIVGRPKKGSMSQKLRQVIMTLHQQQYAGDIDEDAFYKQELIKIIEKYKDKLI